MVKANMLQNDLSQMDPKLELLSGVIVHQVVRSSHVEAKNADGSADWEQGEGLSPRSLDEVKNELY